MGEFLPANIIDNSRSNAKEKESTEGTRSIQGASGRSK